MRNNLSLSPPWRTLAASFLGISILAAPLEANAIRYKKSTTIDFDGATVEGKSRKPYSAYVTQKTIATSAELASWELDYESRQNMGRRTWGHK